jgi:hypothetical protein
MHVMTMDHKFIDLWEMTMSREVLEILEKMDKKELKTQLALQ